LCLQRCLAATYMSRLGVFHSLRCELSGSYWMPGCMFVCTVLASPFRAMPQHSWQHQHRLPLPSVSVRSASSAGKEAIARTGFGLWGLATLFAVNCNVFRLQNPTVVVSPQPPNGKTEPMLFTTAKMSLHMPDLASSCRCCCTSC
jgi:hypothetical protein